jgi:CDP-diacylglycerol--serine O-phosphatidyltransferase
MVFDFLDGFAARMLKVSSAIGKELDSLADMVTFGVLPSMIVFQLLEELGHSPLNFLAFSIAVFSGLRLAIFNVDERQQSVFIGLPTPANALFLSSLIFVFIQFPSLNNTILLISVSIIFSFLLVAPLELFALKFKNYSWNDNIIRYSFLIICILLIIGVKLLALPLIIILYLIISVFNKVTSHQVLK